MEARVGKPQKPKGPFEPPNRIYLGSFSREALQYCILFTVGSIYSLSLYYIMYVLTGHAPFGLPGFASMVL